MARKEKTFISEKMADGRHDMKKAEIPRADYLRLFVRKIISGSEREENQQYRKTSCNKDHFVVRIPEYLRCQHQVAGIDPHTVKESTYSCYLTLIQKHILTYFNNNSIITSEHIQQFINYKITNGLSPTSVRNIVVLLERILRYGEDEICCRLPSVLSLSEKFFLYK